MTAISHSRVESYLRCRRADFYGYQWPNPDGSRGIRRIRTSESLALGSAIHRCLAAFYQKVLEAGDSRKAQKAAFDIGVAAGYEELAVLIGEGYENSGGRYSTLEEILLTYFEHEPFVNQGYIVLAVEQEFRLEYDTETDSTYPFIIDLIVRDPQGRVAVVDHKSSFYLFQEDSLDLMPQIPKYIAGVRALGYPAAYGIYNVLRTQKVNGGKMLKADIIAALQNVMLDPPKNLDKLLIPALTDMAHELGIETVKPPEVDQVLQQLDFEPSPTRITRTFEEQIGVAAEIQARDAMPIELVERTAWRVANKLVCNNCQFSAICAEQLRGGNVKAALANDYEPKPRRELVPVSNGDDDDE